jgi:hypothetical protein
MKLFPLILAIIASLSLAPHARAAEPAAGGATNDMAVLIDETMPWQHLHLEGPSYFRLADATNTPAAFASQWQLGAVPPSINTASGTLVKVGVMFVEGQARPMPWRPEWTSPLPPADWTGPAFDDSAWARLYWPQPEWVEINAQENGSKVRAPNPYDTVVLLARHRFVIVDPTQVKACRLSLDYWGGVVVYVNGKEAVRRHLITLPGGKTNLFDNVAEAYPESEWNRPAGKAPESAPLVRHLEEVEIPAALLRPGVNVLAVEAHAAPVHGKKPWPPIGLLSARLSVSPAGAGGIRPRGIQVRNAATTEDLSICDPADSLPLRPIVVRAARNTIFSGRLVVGADAAIKGLKVTAGDLGRVAGGATLPASAVRVRCAVPAPAGKSWRGGFDGLMDAIPAEIPLVTNAPPQRGRAFYCVPAGPETKLPPRAVAPLWFTVRVPKDAAPGVYEGRVTLTADGWAGTNLPLRVHVSAWTAPDPKDWRMQNFLYHAEEAVARHYMVTNYSPRHLELVGKSLALLAEINSRQVQANLVIGFATTTYMGGSGQGNPESLVRWIKQKDGTFKHDFTNFDRYLDMVAQAIGKPRTLRLNCWGAKQWNPSDLDKPVTVYDPATGQLSTLKQPSLGTPENYAFWKPVFDGVLERLKARGWLDETTLGYNPWNGGVPPPIVDVAYKLWPEGEWSWTGHNPQEGAMVGSSTSIVMKVRNANTVYCAADPGRTPAWLLDGPRRSTIIWTARMLQSDYSPLREIRRLEELYGMMAGYDGLGEFGADLFPVKTPVGGYATPAAGAGTGWVSPGRSTLALLYPGPDGPVATERFEVFREGVELCEAVLFIRQSLVGEKFIGAMQKKSYDYIHQPDEAISNQGGMHAHRWAKDGTEPGKRLTDFNRGAFVARYMQAEEDARLLDLAGEVVEDLRISGAAKAYGAKATGGTFTNLTDGFWVHRFMAVGTNRFTPTEDITVEYLVVGGGGGGATGGGGYGTGGGGAGGLVTSVSGCYSGGGAPGIGSAPNQPVRLKAGTAYSVTVGDGGTAGNNGQDSVFGNAGAEFARAKGGGAGVGRGNGVVGGSGGGGAWGGSGGAGTTNQGFAGGSGGGGNGDNGGGGGGAGGVGVASTSTVNRAKGGPGLMNTITCNSVIYAGGGGGGGNDGNGTGGGGGGGNARGATGAGFVDGTRGTGGGGGGGQSGAGGKGGSGIVIIRYKAGANSAP